jgi:hypothetical protein
MTDVIEHTDTDSFLKTLKSEMANAEAWELTQTWGEGIENAMTRQALKDWESYENHEVTMMLNPGTAKHIQEDQWVMGYQFLITHVYFDINDVALGERTESIFLAWNEEGKIIKHYAWKDLLDFTPLVKGH